MSGAAKSQAHLKRWATGLALLPLLIFCVVAGGAVFTGLVGLAALVCLWEYFRIVCPAGTRAFADPVLLTGYGAGVLLLLAAHAGRAEVMAAVLAGNVIVCGLILLVRFPVNPAVTDLVAKEIQGVCYIPLFLAFLVMLRASPEGMTWIFFVCATIFAGDIAALYAGTLWGRRKLSPAISPGKSVAGAVAGLTANLLVGLTVKLFFLPALPGVRCLLFAAALGAAGQAGDLFESALKRVSKVKDSGGLLPGHGGILDRIDALLFAAPVAYVFRTFAFG
jgi:phosphatidate cytidylyltransferase